MSDGPNVNLKFLDIIKKQRRHSDQKELLEIGTYCIHTVYCVFKYGSVASAWGIDKVLLAMYLIFDQSPFKRADYERLIDGVYPLQLYSHWWAENEKMTVRAIALWENIQIVVNFWMAIPKSKQPFEKNKSCIRLKTAVTDS